MTGARRKFAHGTKQSEAIKSGLRKKRERLTAKKVPMTHPSTAKGERMARKELAKLMKLATAHWIGGRDPNPDWFGEGPKKDRTLCVRLTFRDRDRILKALASHTARMWQPISSLPEGEHVLLYWPHGELGVGGIECGMVFRFDGVWSYWTHGGPNSGSDWEPANGEMPTNWMPLPDPPNP